MGREKRASIITHIHVPTVEEKNNVDLLIMFVFYFLVLVCVCTSVTSYLLHFFYNFTNQVVDDRPPPPPPNFLAHSINCSIR